MIRACALRIDLKFEMHQTSNPNGCGSLSPPYTQNIIVNKIVDLEDCQFF